MKTVSPRPKHAIYTGSISAAIVLMTSKFGKMKLTWARAPTDKQDRKLSILEIGISQTRQIRSHAGTAVKY